MTDVWDGNEICLKWETNTKTHLKRGTLNSNTGLSDCITNNSFTTQGYRVYLCLHSRSLMSSENDNILWTHSTEELIYKGNKTDTQKAIVC